MTPMEISDVLRDGIFVALKIGGPLLILSMLVGVLVAIFQAVTQVHEQTIAFAFKLAVIIIVCLMFGNRMLESLVEYSQQLFTYMAG